MTAPPSSTTDSGHPLPWKQGSRTHVKICGLKTDEDVLSTIEAGADYIGLVSFPRSPRHLDPADAARLADLARNRIQTVVLLVNPDDRHVKEICQTVKPDFIQLHGNEPPERVREIRALSRCGVIKAMAVATQDDLGLLADYEDSSDIILLDAKPVDGQTGLPGGNGISFDWELLDNQKLRPPFMLAGGLDPENVSLAVSLTGAHIVDVSSGVESLPGKKDHDRIRQFITAARAGDWHTG